MLGYTDKSSIEKYLGKVISELSDECIYEWIEAVENNIQKITGRTFITTKEEEERVYDGSGNSELLVDDFISIKTLKIDGVEIEEENEDGSKNFYLYPVNKERKYKIKLASNYFTRGNQNVAIEAFWGYSAKVPMDIKLATTILVAGIYKNSSPDQTKRSVTIGNYSVSYDNDKGWSDFNQANKLINSYRKVI